MRFFLYTQSSTIGQTEFFLRNTLGKNDNTEKKCKDYFTGGMLLPGRNFNSNNYRFGFNDKENDNEVYGATGTFQDYGMRMYDTRVCRFISVDPLTADYPWYTPYQFAGNNPIQFIDLDGEEPVKPASAYKEFEVVPGMDPSGNMMNWMSKGGQWEGAGKAIDVKPSGNVAPTTSIADATSKTTIPIPKIDIKIPEIPSSKLLSKTESSSKASSTNASTDAQAGQLISYMSTGVTLAGELRYCKDLGFWMNNKFQIKTMSQVGRWANGGTRSLAKVTGGIVSKAGTTLGVINYAFIQASYENHEIGRTTRNIEMISNTIGTFTGIWGVAWNTGWESGRLITNTNWYQDFKESYWKNHETFLGFRQYEDN